MIVFTSKLYIIYPKTISFKHQGFIMSRPPSRTNTANRIVEASLQLFNEQGERNISTNHIASHMGISPGNLYYHFNNKDEIIIQLFKRYSHELLDYLSKAKLPESIEQMIDYMMGIYDVMWEYRFLFSDVNTLLNRSVELVGEHNEFTRAKIAPLLVKLFTQWHSLGMIDIDERGKQDLSINIWLVTKYWFDFDSSMQPDVKITEQAKYRGVYRSLSLIRPYVRPEHRAEFDALLVAK